MIQQNILSDENLHLDKYTGIVQIQISGVASNRI